MFLFLQTINTIFLKYIDINNLFLNYFNKIVNDNYILIHFDEKWLDLSEINISLASQILNLQKNLGCSLVLTAYNNNFTYFNNLKKNFTYY